MDRVNDYKIRYYIKSENRFIYGVISDDGKSIIDTNTEQDSYLKSYPYELKYASVPCPFKDADGNKLYSRDILVLADPDDFKDRRFRGQDNFYKLDYITTEEKFVIRTKGTTFKNINNMCKELRLVGNSFQNRKSKANGIKRKNI